MDEKQEIFSRMKAITISREYGSGGGEIASRLATRLNWKLIDHEVVVLVAQQLGISEADADSRDERVESFISRLLTSLQAIEPMMPITTAAVPTTPTLNSQAYYEARRKVIEGAVATGHVVIVGRGAQALLNNRRDVLHVRIIAPLDARIAYVMHRESMDRDKARTRIQTIERERSRYLQEEHKQHPDDPHLYDLIINTAILELDSAVDLICQCLEYKAARLGTTTGELGPGVGLSPYPQPPVDFRPTEPAS